MKLLITLLALTLTACIHAAPATDGIYAQPTYTHGVKRIRSQSAKNEFKRLNPCPINGHRRGTCPGYVIDHVIALACGGADDPSNMQWQTIEEGKLKDKTERIGC